MSAYEPLVAAHAEVKAEIARTDSKASLLLAFDGAVGAGAWSVATSVHLPVVALVVGGFGLAALAASSFHLLSTVRLNISGRHGFPLWATLSPQEIAEHLAASDLAADIAGLSRLAKRKFARLQRAIDLTRVAGVLLIVAAVAAAWGGR